MVFDIVQLIKLKLSWFHYYLSMHVLTTYHCMLEPFVNASLNQFLAKCRREFGHMTLTGHVCRPDQSTFSLPIFSNSVLNHEAKSTILWFTNMLSLNHCCKIGPLNLTEDI